YQIEDRVNGFLVSSIEEAAERIVQVIKNKKLRERLGQRARETVRKRVLLTRLLEQYLDLFNSFETNFRLKEQRGLTGEGDGETHPHRGFVLAGEREGHWRGCSCGRGTHQHR